MFLKNVKNALLLEQMLNLCVFEKRENALLLKQMLNLGVFEKHEKYTFAKTDAKFRCFWKT